MYPSIQNTKKEQPAERLAAARHDATEYRHAYHIPDYNYMHRREEQSDAGRRREPPAFHKMNWSPHLKAMLEGIHDEDSPLSLLRGYEDSILKQIYQIHVLSRKDAVQLTTPTSDEIAFSPCGRVVFPEPRDRSVNMLPFILGDKYSLPKDLQVYHDFILDSCPLEDSELGKVLYLTVEEGWVKAGNTQRRGGLHIESPRYTEFRQTPSHEHGDWCGIEGRIGWGRGVLRNDKFVGGLYMASTVSRTCRVYHALVDKTAVDSHGGLDFLSHLFIPSADDDTHHGYDMQGGELVWMTDRTPHQVLPQQQSEYRQFFRLVTSSLSIWNAVHNTPNPKVPLPPHVLVIKESRFSSEDK